MSGKTRQATIPVTEIEQAAFCKTEEDLPAKSPAQDLAVDVYCLLHGGHGSHGGCGRRLGRAT